MVVDGEGTTKYHFTWQHICYVATKKMREGYLLQKPWVCQVFLSLNKLNNPKLNGSTITTMIIA
jgi:hypothetical protein